MISLLERIINLIAPRACVMCGCRLAPGEEIICASCNLSLPRTDYADDPYENEMAKLFWVRLPIERAGALFFYQSHARPSHIIYDLKYHNHPEYGVIMGRMLAKEYQKKGFFEGIDGIVPVPLAHKRQRQRGYNQSMEIARGVSEISGIPVINDAVRRNVFENSQTQKDRWQRNENVEHVFQLVNPEKVRGRHILIIDDVVTTGATVCACGTQLAKAGDVKISVLSLGFVKS